MRKLFGTDGIRGLANEYPMTAEVAMEAGRAVAEVLRENSKSMQGLHRRRIVVGKDTRLSCSMLENALAAGISSAGVDVLQAGVLPTPAVAFLTTSMRAGAGVVISASHNPFFDNGIKLFSADGFKLPDEVEADIERRIFTALEKSGGCGLQKRDIAAEEIGRARRIDDARGRYIVFLKSTFPKNLTLEGLHIVIDCANGATYGVAPYVFEELGARVTTLSAAPNGININAECGALHPEKMAAAVKESGADIGLAFDGDGDRLIVCDECGEIVDGDHIMAVCAEELLAQNRLAQKTLAATVMSNLGLEIAMKKMGGRLVRTDVGDRYVVEEMRRSGFSFGGEQSGHLIFLDHITTGDGILAALQLLAIIVGRGKPLSELAEVMESVPQVLHNVRTAEKIAVDSIAGLSEAVADFDAQLGDSGRVLVRPSGTEPLIRVMVEGESMTEIEDIAQELSSHIKRAGESGVRG